MDIKNLISDSLLKQINSSIEASGGIKSVFGEPIKLGNQDIIPVARLSITLSSNAAAKGGGDIDQDANAGGLGQVLKGGGTSAAGAGINIGIEPVGYITGDAKFIGISS